MIKIFINEKEYKVESDKTLLEILKERGFEIPFYCYHPNLRITASCRVCAVEIEIKGIKRIVTSCSTFPQEGMKIFPYSENSKKARRNIIEFLLLHHPLDCPLCEKGGKCFLQDYTYKFGNSTSNFVFPKTLPPRKKFGEFIKFYQTRCILCYRCSNFIREELYADTWLSFKRGSETFVGPFGNKLKTEIPFLGYLVHVCPVGAILDEKDYKYGPRPWDTEEKESPCILCSTGCEINFWIRKKRRTRVFKGGVKSEVTEIYKVSALDHFRNPTIFCDRIFYGKDFIKSEKRIFKGKNNIEIRGKIKEIVNKMKSDEIAFLISPRETTENLKKIKKFILKNNIKNVSLLPGVYHSGTQKFKNQVDLEEFEKSFVLLFYSPLDFSHPVIGFELFRIMKEGKRIKGLKSAFFEIPHKKDNFFTYISGWEDRFLKGCDYPLKLELKDAYELMLDILTILYKEQKRFPNKNIKINADFLTEQKLKERKLKFEQQSNFIIEKIKKHQKFIVVFPDFLPLNIQILLKLISEFHNNGEVLVLRSTFNSEGALRLFENFDLLPFYKIKENIKKGKIKFLFLYRVHPLFDTFDSEFAEMIREEGVKYIFMDSFYNEYTDKNDYNIFLTLPYEYGGTFIDNFGKEKKINKIFENKVYLLSYHPESIFEDIEIEPEEKSTEISINLKQIVDYKVKKKVFYPFQTPHKWAREIIFSDNLSSIRGDFSLLNPVINLYTLYKEKEVYKVLRGEPVNFEE